MTITYYDNEIQRASGFFDENGNPDPYCVYADSGQGCRTVWFKSVSAARRAILSEEGLKHGYDLFDCTKCGCHYSVTQEGFKKYPMHACSDAKMAYAKSFEKNI